MTFGEFYREALVHLSFFVPIAILCYIIYWIIIKHALKKKTIIDGIYHETEFLDDYYPSQRKIKYDSSPLEESGVHRKLNYQYVIERMTRKLFYTLILIVLFTLSFTYLLYNTSISERIAPDEIVMKQYGLMLDNIMNVEQKLEDKQIKPIIELGDACHIDSNTKTITNFQNR